MIGRRFWAQFQPNIASAFVIIVLTINTTTSAQAYWCANYQTGGSNCSFRTFSQCLASVSGIGGLCNEFPENAPAAKRERRQRTISKPQRNLRPSDTQTAPRPAPKAAPRPAVAPAPAPRSPLPTAQAVPSTTQFDSAFAQARQLILSGQYEAGLAAMQALNFNDHPDVATYIGLATGKLGRTDEAKSWYARALAADPSHKLALSFQGMLRLEQGDIPGAQGNLARIGRLCGNTSCNEYRALEAVIAARIR